MPADALERKIGNMILVGFRGLTITDNDPIAEDLLGERIGGVVLFDRDLILKSSVRNIADPLQLKKLILDLKTRSQNPLLVGIDQEGGLVSRLKPQNGFTETVSQRHLGKQDNPELTRMHSESSAALLAELGFNLNFSPCVDLDIDPDSPAIGRYERSFSADAKVVVHHARIVMQSLMKHGIIPVLKHFPGHGSAGADTHLGLTDVSETWTRRELQPFRRLISEEAPPMVMTAHIVNRRLDAKHPASLSKKVVGGLLRQDLGFTGVVVSDDLDMKAITMNYSFERTIELAVNAGVDILMFGNNLSYDPHIARRAIDTVLKLVDQNRILPERIVESFHRIEILKSSLISR